MNHIQWLEAHPRLAKLEFLAFFTAFLVGLHWMSPPSGAGWIVSAYFILMWVWLVGDNVLWGNLHTKWVAYSGPVFICGYVLTACVGISFGLDLSRY